MKLSVTERDEPSIELRTRSFSLILWYGTLRQWSLGFGNHIRDQNPHLQWWLGPLSLAWWLSE